MIDWLIWILVSLTRILFFLFLYHIFNFIQVLIHDFHFFHYINLLFFLLIPKGFLILNLFHNLIFFIQIEYLLFARNLLFLRFIVNNHLRITYNTLQLRLLAFTEDDSGIYFWELFWILKSTIIIKSDLRLINWNVSVLPYILSIFNQLILKFVFEISCRCCWWSFDLDEYTRIIYCSSIQTPC